ncbi:hypothetical protein EB796_022173 [Bugula neritina]|uniref:Uncharacterized protein n=1 Tax=Bugula neritina TaxID=10212 RepID=A0A7J7J022_BUGNE|nr:hypothetical protein EB796_022173 [Bugula neritina]
MLLTAGKGLALTYHYSHRLYLYSYTTSLLQDLTACIHTFPAISVQLCEAKNSKYYIGKFLYFSLVFILTNQSSLNPCSHPCEKFIKNLRQYTTRLKEVCN